MYTIYMTRPGETLDKIAFYYYGSNEPYLIAQLALLNPLLQLEGGTHVLGGHLAPYQAIALPDDFMTAGISYQMITDTLNAMPRDDRRLLTDLQDAGLDPNLLLAAAEASYIPPTVKTKKQSSLLENIEDFVLGTIDTGIGLTEERLNNFNEKLTDLEDCLEKYKNLPVRKRYAYFKKFVRTAYEEVLTAYQQRINFYYPRRMNIPGRNKLRRLVHVKGFSLRNYDDVHLLTRLLPCARLAEHGFLLLDVGSRLKKVKTVYNNHGNWEKELAVQSGGFLGGYLTGALAGRVVGGIAADLVVTAVAMSTAEIWITAIVVISVVTLIGERGGERGVELLGKWLGELPQWFHSHHFNVSDSAREILQSSLGNLLYMEGIPLYPELIPYIERQ